MKVKISTFVNVRLGMLENCVKVYIGFPKKVSCLCSCCGGAVDSILSIYVQLHRSGFNLEFETMFESI